MSRMNVLLVVIDTGRVDRCGCYGYPRLTTPSIDDLAQEAALAERMIAPAPWTLPSHASLFTGLYPQEHGADYPEYRMRSGPLLLDEHLQRYGYRTIYFSNNPLVAKRTGIVSAGSDLRLRRDIDPGSRRAYLRVARALMGQGDRGSRATTREVGRALQAMAGPFFIFVNFMESHWRYVAPEAYARRFVRRRFSRLDAALYRRRIRRRYSWENGRLADPKEIQLLSDLYDASLAYMDDCIGDLLDAVDRSGHRNDTIVIVTADHGEQIGEHGLSGHAMWLYETLLHVPFVVRIPGCPPARMTGLVQLTDVFAGLCQVLGVEIPPYLKDREFAAAPAWLTSGLPNRQYAFARWHYSADADLHHRLVRSNFTAPPDTESVQDMRYKLIAERESGKACLFDLQADPAETRDCSSAVPQERDRLFRILQEWRGYYHPVGAARPYTPEEERVLESRLRELGYI